MKCMETVKKNISEKQWFWDSQQSLQHEHFMDAEAAQITAEAWK